MSRTINCFCTCFEMESSTHKATCSCDCLQTKRRGHTYTHTHTQRSAVSARRFLCSAWQFSFSFSYFLSLTFYFACPPTPLPSPQPYCKQDHYPVPYPFISTEAVFLVLFPFSATISLGGWAGPTIIWESVQPRSKRRTDGWLTAAAKRDKDQRSCKNAPEELALTLSGHVFLWSRSSPSWLMLIIDCGNCAAGRA